MSQINVETRFMVDDDTWPPEQPTSFTPLLLIHCKGHRTSEEVTTMAELMHTSGIDKVAMVTGEQPTVKHTKLDGREKFGWTPVEQRRNLSAIRKQYEICFYFN